MKKKLSLYKIDVHSLKFRVWLTIILFSAAIIALLWISQVIFLNYYINNYKRKELKSAADDIIANFGNEARYGAIVNKYGCSLDIIHIHDGEYTIAYTSNGIIFGLRNAPAGQSAIKMISSMQDGDAFYKDSQKSLLIYCCTMQSSNNLVLVLSQSTTLTDSTTSILQTQMWIATITIIALAFCVSFFMSGILSKDISNLSQASKQLAKCDYDVRFEEKGCTEISEIASTLNYATQEIAKVEKLRRELIANVSHDLRTPLTLIKGYAEMIKDLTGDNKQKREANLDVIIKEADRLSVLVRDMLNISQMEASPDSLNIAELSLSVLVADASKSFVVLNDKEGYNISCETEPDLFVKGDVMRLQLATYNLISNAVNYTGEDKKVTIKLYRIKGNNVRFEVTDTGDGISEEQLNQIWEKYYRAKEHKRSVVGSGLGLSIVKKVLTLHNAEYGVESELGKGSTFWYELPLIQQATTEVK